MQHPPTRAFSLVELSIVLVILGLLIGGILAGKALIQAATIRSQITQIDKLRVATHTFRDKYMSLPGDLPLATANALGYYTNGCNGLAGGRDGNGIIQTGANEYHPVYQENALYWLDLSQSGLIENKLPGNGAALTNCYTVPTLDLVQGSTYIGSFLPEAKIGNGSFLYTTYANPNILDTAGNAQNVVGGFDYLTISAITSVAPACMASNPAISVIQAYGMDMKTDDGMPNTGRVIAQYASCATAYRTGSQASHTPTSCWNNVTNTYSINQNNGDGINCGLSFKLL